MKVCVLGMPGLCEHVFFSFLQETEKAGRRKAFLAQNM